MAWAIVPGWREKLYFSKAECSAPAKTLGRESITIIGNYRDSTLGPFF
jgi:hypothetical protein